MIRTRPNIATGYGISKAEAGLLTWEWVVEQIEKSRNYWICSTRPDGRPHAAPVWGVWVEGKLCFGSDRAAVRARNFTANPAVVVHLESGDEVVILEGRVEELTDPTIFPKYNQAYQAKYGFNPGSEPNSTSGITYTLSIQTAFAWLEKDYPNTATRWKF